MRSKVLVSTDRFLKTAAFAVLATFLCAEARAQVDADFAAFCREKFPGSQPEKTEMSYGIQHTCNQGGTRQGIDLSEACRLTTGHPEHKIMGSRVICTGSGPTTAEQIAGPLDLSAYCRKNFPNSIPEALPEPTGITHYCRQPGATGGFTRRAVDLAEACQQQRNVSGFQKVGTQVVCMQSGATASAKGGDGKRGGGGGTGGGRKFPPLEPKDIIDTKGTGELSDKNVKLANLQGCGNGDPDYSMKFPFESMKRGLGEQTFDFMGLDMPCPGLTGGKVVDFQEACNSFSGARPPMTARVTPWGVPVCWPNNRRWRPPKLGATGWGINSAPLTGVCYQARLGRPAKREDQIEMVALLKYKLRALQVECFYIKRDVLTRLIKSAQN